MEKQADKMTRGKWSQASQSYKPQDWKFGGRQSRIQTENFEASTGIKLPTL